MQKRYHTLENIIFDAIVYLVMAFVLICCLVPFIYMLAVSFSGTKPLINGEVFLWPKDFTLDSYKQIFTYPNFFKAYGNTFLYAVGGTAIALIMTSLMAYPLSKTFLWGNKFFTKMVHLNVTYLLEADAGDALRAKPDENSGVRWFMLDEAVEASTEEWMRTRVYEKLNRKVRALG